MKKIKNFELEIIVSNLQKENSLLNNTEKEMSISFLWKLNKNLKLLENNFNALREMIGNIQNKYANEKYSELVDGQSWQVKDEFLSDYHKEINDVYDIEEEYDIDMVSIKDIEEYKMTLAEFDCIKFMIED